MAPPPSLWRVEGESLHLTMHEGQQRAWDSDKRFVFCLAGTQSGKTSWGPFWLQREMLRRGQGDYLAVTATYDLFKLKMLPELEAVFVDLLGGSYRASDRVIDYEGSRIILRSAESDRGLESASAKAAWLDECGMDVFSLETWEAVLRRLSLSQGRVLGTTTLYNLGWLVDGLERWKQGELSDYDYIQWTSLANPLFPREEYERAKREMPAWRFSMFYQGQPARPAGLIYGDFDSGLHWIPPFEIPTDWPRYVGIDPGGDNTGIVWIAREPESGLCYLYRELHTGDLSTPELVEKVKSYEPLTGAWGGAVSEKQMRLDWHAAGLPVHEPVVGDVEQGIDRVVKLFRANRLYVFNTCRGVRDQLGTYSRVLDASGNVTEKIGDKARYHLLDALRYVAGGLERKPFRQITVGSPAFVGTR